MHGDWKNASRYLLNSERQIDCQTEGAERQAKIHWMSENALQILSKGEAINTVKESTKAVLVYSRVKGITEISHRETKTTSGRSFIFIGFQILIHSFTQANSKTPLQVHNTTQRRSRHSTDTVWLCVGVSSRSATGNYKWRTCPRFLYVASRAGFEPTTLRTKATNLPMSHHAPQ